MAAKPKTPRLKWFAGRQWPWEVPDNDVARKCFYERIEGGVESFWFLVESYWGPKAPRQFVKNPWSERMVEAACAEQFLGVSGCGSSSKSSTFAIWALLCWLSAPEKTKVLVTSTSKTASRNRIWGYIARYYAGASEKLPGKLVDSMTKIMADRDQDPEADAMAGIELIAADQSRERDAVSKIIGIHNENAIIILDELAELGPGVLEAVFGNFILNPKPQVIALSNFASIYDPFGQFTTPVRGWNSVNVETEEWETICNGVKGRCIRFDGTKSPNILAGEDIYPFLYRIKDLERHRAGGENSPRFWRMCRSFPCPSGDEHTLMSEADFIAGQVHESPHWTGKPTRLAACDPAWTKDGDDCVVLTADYGEVVGGQYVLAFDKVEVLHGDAGKIGESISIQRAKLLIAFCRQEEIPEENLGIDVSGGGLLFADLVSEFGWRRFHRTNFNGSPSEYIVSGNETGKEKFTNRVSELWGRCAEFVRSGQIKRLPVAVARDWESRLYDNVKFDGGLRVQVESKKLMKLRLLRSPDYGDAGAIVIDVACEVLGAHVGTVIGGESQDEGAWDEYARRENEVYESGLDKTRSPYHVAGSWKP